MKRKREKVEVQCSVCGVKYLKDKWAVKNWDGKCNYCAKRGKSKRVGTSKEFSIDSKRFIVEDLLKEREIEEIARDYNKDLKATKKVIAEMKLSGEYERILRYIKLTRPEWWRKWGESA